MTGIRLRLCEIEINSHSTIIESWKSSRSFSLTLEVLKMGLISKWIESLDYEYKVTESCLRWKSPKSSCRACVDSCVEGALSFRDGKPYLDSGKCKECGHCLAACPIQAIEGIIPKRSVSSDQLVAIRDEVPSVNELLILHAKDIKTILFADSEMDEAWKTRIHKTNDDLLKLEREPFTVKTGIAFEEKSETYSRRELFSFLSTEGKTLVKQAAPAKWRFNQTNLELAQHYPDHQFFDITIDTSKCTLCKACEALCPKDCFSLEENTFTLTAQSCASCQLCSDICPENAVSISTYISKAAPKTFEVFTKTCSCCKNVFKSPRHEDQKCHVCEKRKVGFLQSHLC